MTDNLGAGREQQKAAACILSIDDALPDVQTSHFAADSVTVSGSRSVILLCIKRVSYTLS